MPKCTAGKLDFGRVGRRVIEGAFDGGDLSSDGGLMPLSQVDRRIGLTKAAAAVIPDARVPARIEHKVGDLLRQRIYAFRCAAGTRT